MAILPRSARLLRIFRLHRYITGLKAFLYRPYYRHSTRVLFNCQHIEVHRAFSHATFVQKNAGGPSLLFFRGDTQSRQRRLIVATMTAAGFRKCSDFLCKLCSLRYTFFSASQMHSSSVRNAKSACSSSIRSGGESRSEFSPAPSTSRPL